VTWRSEIKTHYDEVWGASGIPCELDEGPIHELPVDFSVLKYPPRPKRRLWTYATLCMSQPRDLYPVELHMLSPYESLLIVELLHATAHYHRTGAKVGLCHR
jgi:hypothetical protein